MKELLHKLTEYYKSEKFQRIWKDPVWSKIIAVAIVGVCSSIYTLLYYVWKTFNVSNIFGEAKTLLLSAFSSILLAVDTWVTNELVNLFVKTFAVLMVLFLLMYILYYNTKSYWQKLFLRVESDEGKEHILDHHPADLFDYRLAKAFPGIHGLQWFTNSSEAAHRLEVLLKKPIQYKVLTDEGKVSGYVDVFWWYRDGTNLFIRDFKILKKSLCLLNNSEELNINKIAVFRTNHRRTSYIYVETKPLEGVGELKKADSRVTFVATKQQGRD